MKQPDLSQLILVLALAMLFLLASVFFVMLIARRAKIKQQLLQAQTQNRLLETQYAALRSQMNPHFIFNCLTSIRLFTEQNNGHEASRYLTKIASLMRHILDYARTERITLDEELNALKLYLELEALRFKEKFSFTITVDDEVDKEFIEVPPLIIQPIAENAIIHGLVHKPVGGRLKVHVQYDSPAQNFLRIIIDDNGIGRQASATIKSATGHPHTSHGIQILKERLQLLSKHNTTGVDFFSIEDLYFEGHAAGTRVILNLPLS